MSRKDGNVLLGPDQARRHRMAWTRPKLRELCIGMEINGYFAGKL
jgi:coenzyme PQQ precursor peptide PqqA